MTRSKKGLGNMMTRKILCDADDINFHMISEDFDKVSGKVKGSGDITTSSNKYTISIDYFDNTTPENLIKTNYIIPTKEQGEKTVLLFCQVDVLHIQKDANPNPIIYSLKGIFSLLKSYCLAEGNSVVLNNTEFKKDDLEYFLNIIYKCIVFSQHQNATSLGVVVERFNMYSHFLFNIAKKVNLAVNDNSQNKANRISELNMPIDIVKDMFDMDKFERFINILVAVRFEYDRREKEFLEKINKFNLLKEDYKKAKKETEPQPEQEPEPEPEPKAEPAHNLPTSIDKLIKGSSEFIEEIDRINDEFSGALAEEKKQDPAELQKEQDAQQQAENDIALALKEQQAAKQAAQQAAQQAEDNLAKVKEKALRKSRDEEISKRLLMTVLIDMKEEQLRDELDKDLDEYFAARPVKVIENVTQDYNYCKKQKYEQAFLCYNGTYTKQLLDHINGIITLSDINMSKADSFITLINSLLKDPISQTLIQYNKLNEMKQYFDALIPYYRIMKKHPTQELIMLKQTIDTNIENLNNKDIIKISEELKKIGPEQDKMKDLETIIIPFKTKAEENINDIKIIDNNINIIYEDEQQTKINIFKTFDSLKENLNTKIIKLKEELYNNINNIIITSDKFYKEIKNSMKNIIKPIIIESVKNFITKFISINIDKVFISINIDKVIKNLTIKLDKTEEEESDLYEIFLETILETIYDILESIARSIISDMNYDYSNRNRNYNQYIILKNNYLSTFRNDLIENANCRSTLREMNMEYVDEPLAREVTELCGSLDNKVCLGKRKEDQRGGSKKKKITLDGKKYKIHIIDGKKYITMNKKKVLLSDAKKAAKASPVS
jgi:hypothetical protein